MMYYRPALLSAIISVVATAGAAQATPLLSLEATNGTTTLSGTDAGQGTPGGVVVTGTIGNFNLTFNVGTGSTIPGIDLSSTEVSSGAGSINVFLTYSNLTGPAGPLWSTNLGTSVVFGTDTFAVKTFLDPNNSVFTTHGTQLGSLSEIAGGPEMSTTGTAAIPTGPYSITEELTITATGTSQNGSTVALASVPEPDTIALMGVGLFGLGLVRRRNRG